MRALAILVALLLVPSSLQGAEPLDARSLARLSSNLSQAEKEIRTIERRGGEGDRDTMRAKVEAVLATTSETIGQLQEYLASVDVRLRQLGRAPAGVVEAPDIRLRRSALLRERSAIDTALKRAKLVSLDAKQLQDGISRSEEQELSQKLMRKSPSPLSPGFWATVGHAFPRDVARLEAFAAARNRQAELASGPRWPAVGGFIIAVLLLGPGQLAARRFGKRFLTEGTPGRRVRRSANAFLRVTIGTLSPLLASAALVQGAFWSDLLPPAWEEPAFTLIAASTFAGLTISVLGALLMRSAPSWRIPAISDATASAMRPLSLLLGGVAFFGIMLASLNRTVGASEAATAAGQALMALLHLLLIGATLLTLGRLRAAAARVEVDSAAAHPGSVVLVLLVWILAGAALIALLVGYIAFSLFLVETIAWSVVLGAGAYLTIVAVDDVITTVLDRSSPVGTALVRGLGIRGSIVDQSGVLLSGILRLTAGVVALGLLLSPFGGGDGVGTMFSRVGSLAQGFEVGGVTVSPGTILRGIIVLVIGLALGRAFVRWLDDRYLPATDLDGSGSNSVSLVARYVCVALAAIWALASLGVGIEKIAILLYALSVGIGFGLQAITQNFVSGLVLLAERPIRIGDIVRIGTDEGDVKRISVRSTEIELVDHSTLIVPNSELITKTVVNKTMASALGRIEIKFSAPLGSDVRRIRAIVLESYDCESEVLTDPAPAFFVDAILDGRILFSSFAHVAGPRVVQKARSSVFMTLLDWFLKEGIEIGTLPQQLHLVGSPVSAASGSPSLGPET